MPKSGSRTILARQRDPAHRVQGRDGAVQGDGLEMAAPHHPPAVLAHPGQGGLSARERTEGLDWGHDPRCRPKPPQRAPRRFRGGPQPGHSLAIEAAENEPDASWPTQLRRRSSLPVTLPAQDGRASDACALYWHGWAEREVRRPTSSLALEFSGDQDA